MSRITGSALFIALLVTGAAPPLASIASAEPEGRMMRPPSGNGLPTEAPPAPQEEHWKPKSGYDWIAGNYQWKRGEWKWNAGHFAPRHRNKRWQAERWEQKGDHYELVAGAYIDAPKQPEEPPAPLEERVIARHGMTWVKGYWQWKDGSYDWVAGHLQTRPHGKRWTDGHWDNAGGMWTWTAGAWAAGSVDPEDAPPPPVEETFKPRAGFVWAKGFYTWDAGAYEWTAGHWEKEHAGKQWQDGHWDHAGGKWTLTVGAWQ